MGGGLPLYPQHHEKQKQKKEKQAKVDESSLTPGIHTMEEENKFTQVALWSQKELRHMQDHKHICNFHTVKINTTKRSNSAILSFFV